MKPLRGYYSLVQFCPDSSRLESVNIGVALFCPDAQFLAAKTAASNQRAKKLVGFGELNKAALNSAKRAIERRLEIDRESFKSLEDLQRFIASRGNTIQLTAPRPVKVFDPQESLDGLFDELVGGKARRKPKEPIAPVLESVFQKLKAEGRAQIDQDVIVPVLERPMHVPYAYRNGVLNLVKPVAFSPNLPSALRAAGILALEGDLLQRHPAPESARRLIIVPHVSEGVEGEPVLPRVENVLKEYQIRVSNEQQLAHEAEREAH